MYFAILTLFLYKTLLSLIISIYKCFLLVVPYSTCLGSNDCTPLKKRKLQYFIHEMRGDKYGFLQLTIQGSQNWSAKAVCSPKKHKE